MRAAVPMLLLSVAASAAGAGALGSAEADGKGAVVQVLAGRDADLVVVAGGHDRGFRPGAVCTVSRDGRPFGTVVVAEAARSRSVALILSLDPAADAPAARIQPGDVVATRANPRI
ncbi:MAG: hypothetical protein ACO3A9_06685 [Opitutales bacterium]